MYCFSNIFANADWVAPAVRLAHSETEKLAGSSVGVRGIRAYCDEPLKTRALALANVVGALLAALAQEGDPKRAPTFSSPDESAIMVPAPSSSFQ